MQGDEPRLGSESDERRYRYERLGAAAGRRERGWVADRAVMSKGEQGNPDARTTEMSDRQVRVNRRANLPVAPIDKDRRRRNERHQLPEPQETDHIPSRENTHQRQQERRSQSTERSCPVAAGQIVARKDQRRHRSQRKNRKKEPAKRIKAKRQTYRAAKPGAEHVAASQDSDAHDTEKHHPPGLHRQSGTQTATSRPQRPAKREHRDTRKRTPVRYTHS